VHLEDKSEVQHSLEGNIAKGRMQSHLQSLPKDFIQQFKSMISEFRKHIADLGEHTSHIENNMADYDEAPNSTTEIVSNMEQQLIQ
ncbi:Hypothetical predicted protein, partial [Pelobates cultripes]